MLNYTIQRSNMKKLLWLSFVFLVGCQMNVPKKSEIYQVDYDLKDDVNKKYIENTNQVNGCFYENKNHTHTIEVQGKNTVINIIYPIEKKEDKFKFGVFNRSREFYKNGNGIMKFDKWKNAKSLEIEYYYFNYGKGTEKIEYVERVTYYFK